MLGGCHRGASLGMLLALCGAPGMAAAQASGAAADGGVEHIHGVVIGSVDKKPIARALVTSGDQRLAVMTDAQGRFSFDVRMPSRTVSGSTPFQLMGWGGFDPTQAMMLYLMARKPGYVPGQTNQKISFVDQPDIVLKLVPESALQGRLSVSQGELPEGVQVQLRGKQVQEGMAMWMPLAIAQANSHGEFRFANLQAGEYKVTTQAWTERRAGASQAAASTFGYAGAFNGDAKDLASTKPMVVAAGETAEVDLELHAGTFYRVSMPVKGMTPGAGVSVAVGDLDGMSGQPLMYNARTQMVEGFLPIGTYDVQVASYGQPQMSGTGRVDVSGMAVEGPPILLTPAGSVAVHVREELTAKPDEGGGQSIVAQIGRPGTMGGMVLNMSLRAMHGMMQGGSFGLSGTDPANMMLSNVQEGTYRVLPQPFRGYVASMTSDGVDLMQHPLVVGKGGASAPIEVTLRDDGATVRGTVAVGDMLTTNAGMPLLIACIPLDQPMRPEQLLGGFEGKFTAQNLAPGRYLLLASWQGTVQNLEYQNPDVMEQYLRKGTVVTLSAGQKADVQVPLLSDEGN